MKHSPINFYLTVFFFSLFISQAHAEKDPIKFGKVSMEDMQLNSYLPDTTASAVILCDYGVTDMPFSKTDGFQMTFERLIRIKILKKEGLDWANFDIPLSKKGDNITSVKGMTYNLENGKIIKTKLKSDGKFIESTSKYTQTYKLTLPNVKVGSVIEYSYSIRSKYFFNLRTWYFQKSIPVKWSEYRVNIPEFFHYKQLSKGYLELAVNKKEYGIGNLFDSETYSIEKFRWAVSEAPAFKEEPFMTTSRNFLSAIEFELGGIQQYRGPYKSYTNTWEKINKELIESESFGQQLKGGGFLKEIVEKINSEAKTDEDKMNMAFDFIKKHMKWNDYNGKYVNTTLRSAFKEKKGNVADINLMLVLLLKKLELNSDPVILSTRNNGMIFPMQPNMSKFNYVVAKIKLGEKDYLLDATEPLCPCNILPFRCINGQGRVISEAGSTWIDLSTSMPYKQITASKLTLNEDGELMGQVTDAHQGYSALNIRKYFEAKTIDELKTSLEEDNQGLSLEEFEIINQDDLEKTLQIKSTVEITDKVEDTGDLLYLNPMLYEQTKKNPFTLEERKYPVDYGHAYDEIYSIEISLPEGCSIETKPENMLLALPNKAGSYTYSIQELGNKILLMSRLRITKPMFGFDEYAGLKEFYKLVVAKQAEMIILKRNS
ncbi:MAG: DUF3857 domain-containing protein [Bacteroidales bacterium]|nr:DUF3857 domain-containing protein [Bacteroidales bacterium]